jgi:hypothetical protein
MLNETVKREKIPPSFILRAQGISWIEEEIPRCV